MERSGLLVKWVADMYDGADRESQMTAHSELQRLKSDCLRQWKVLGELIRSNAPSSAIFFGVTLAEDVLVSHWDQLTDDDRTIIRKNLTDLVEANTEETPSFLSQKVNAALIELVKQVWPEGWSDFIEVICGFGKMSKASCQNSLMILSMFADEIFQYGSSSLVTDRLQHFRHCLAVKAPLVVQFCLDILYGEHAGDLGMCAKALGTLGKYSEFSQLDSRVCTHLLPHFSENRRTEIQALSCYVSILSSPTDPVWLCQTIYKSLITLGSRNLPPDPSESPAQVAYLQEAKVERLSAGLLKSFEIFGNLIEQDISLFKLGLELGAKLLDSRGSPFTALVEFFETRFARITILTALVKEDPLLNAVMKKIRKDSDCHWQYHLLTTAFGKSGLKSPSDLGFQPDLSNFTSLSPCVLELFRIVISHVNLPGHFLVSPSEPLEQDETEEAGLINLWNLIQCLTHLYPQEMTNSTLCFLKYECTENHPEDRFVKLCWFLAGMSGALRVSEEKVFVLEILPDLMAFKDSRLGTRVIVGNIMFVMTEYPRFVRLHESFFSNVLTKAISFLESDCENNQGIGVGILYRLAFKLRSCFVKSTAQIKNLIGQLAVVHPKIRKTDVMVRMYHSFGLILTRVGSLEKARVCLTALLKHCFQHELDTDLKFGVYIQCLTSILKGCGSVIFEGCLRGKMDGLLRKLEASDTTPQTLDLILSLFYEFIRIAIEEDKVYASYQFVPDAAEVLSIRDIAEPPDRLNLIGSKQDLEIYRTLMKRAISNHYPKRMAVALISVFHVHHNDLVLKVFTQLVSAGLEPKLKTEFVRETLEHVLQPTLDKLLSQVNENFIHLQDVFHELLEALATKAFPQLMEAIKTEEDLQHVVNCLIYTCQHALANSAETGLKALSGFLQNMGTVNSIPIREYFFRQHFWRIFKDVFELFVNGLHKANFDLHSQILRDLFYLARLGIGIEVSCFPAFFMGILSSQFRIGEAECQRFAYRFYESAAVLQDFTSVLNDLAIRLRTLVI